MHRYYNQFESMMSPEEQVTFLQYLFDAAWADGALASEEAEILSTILSGIEASDDELTRIRAWFDSAPPEPDWAVARGNAELSEILMRQAMVLAGSDLEYSQDEMAYLERLRERLGMDEAVYHGIWQRVERLLGQGRAGDA